MGAAPQEHWETIKALFRAALTREPHLRAAFISQACAGDSALQSELESLLSSHEEAADFMDLPAVQPTPEPGVEQMQSRIGQRIGPYKLIREIGRGGMGTVFLAERDDGSYQKRVALKCVKRGMDTEAILSRFRSERQIVASLEHPNIARLMDGGTTEDGLPYFVMEHVEGMPLYDYCDAQRLQVVQRLQLFRDVCAAVQCAHERQVVHRDLKPNNILVTTNGVPKLLDFGIAKLLRPDLAPGSDTTVTTLKLMTPEYASPEQVRGEPTTPASDVYALGVLLYELLTGHRPYRFNSRLPDEVARIISEQEPAKPSAVVARSRDGPTADALAGDPLVSPPNDNPERLGRQLVGDLDSIVLKAMGKDPHQRYASVKELIEDIDRHLGGAPVLARKGALWYRTAKLIHRHRARIAGGVLILVAVLVGIAQSFGRWHLPSSGGRIQSIAVLPLEDLAGDKDQEYFVDGMTDELITELAKIRALRVISRTSVMQYKGARKPLMQIAQELNIDAVVEGTVRRSGSRVRITAQLVHAATDQHLWAESYDADLSDVLRVQGKVAQAIAREIRSELTAQEKVRASTFDPINPVAHEAYLRGRYFWAKRTAESLGKAIEYFSKATEIDPNYALAYAGLADSYGALAVNSDTPPKDLFPKAKAMAKKALELDDTVAEAHASLGYALTYFDWDWSGAEREFRRAIELNPSYALARQWHAAFLSAMGRHAEAIAEAKRAQELDPLSLIVGSIAGRCLYHARRYDEAIQQYQKTLEIDSNFWVAHLFLGKAFEQKGMYEQALAELRQAGSVTTEGLSWIGHVHAVQGNSAEAHRVLDELQALAGRRYVPSCHIARIYAGLGDSDQAFAWLQRACEERATRLAHLKVEPTFDPLRSDPRFAELLRCVGLSP